MWGVKLNTGVCPLSRRSHADTHVHTRRPATTQTTHRTRSLHWLTSCASTASMAHESRFFGCGTADAFHTLPA